MQVQRELQINAVKGDKTVNEKQQAKPHLKNNYSDSRAVLHQELLCGSKWNLPLRVNRKPNKN